MEGASRSLLDLLKIGEKTGQLMFIIPALCDLAAIQKVRGRLYLAREHYDKAYQWMLERNGLDMRVRCSYEFGMADLLRVQNQLDAAREHAITGIELRRRLGGYMMIGDLTLMRVLQARGDVEGAMKALRDAEQAVQTHPFQLAMRSSQDRAGYPVAECRQCSDGNLGEECGNERNNCTQRLWLA
jgi:ATP/maltotriose-dependent transcriptional regulator MalT